MITVALQVTDEQKTSYLKAIPVPTRDDGSPVMSEDDWVRHAVAEQFRATCNKGRATGATTLDDLLGR